MIKKIWRFFTNKKIRFNYLCKLGVFDKVSDIEFLKKRFRIELGYELDLENPKSINEKMQWLKIYDRNPEYTKMVDKYEVKKYVAEKIGEQYIIPTIDIWKDYNEIDFSKLPNSFVLKCTHDSGGVVVVKDKNKIDLNYCRKFFNKSLKANYYLRGREWPYKNVQPRIIAEKYMEDESGYELKDYKFFCFNGQPQIMFVASDRQVDGEETKFDFYDMNYNLLPFTNGHPNSVRGVKKPSTFEEMKELAKNLSSNIPFVRVDFYDINGQIYFGELTFTHWSGFVGFDPIEWDYKLGDWLALPEKPM